MATPTGIATAARQAASGFALRALPRRKTYTTSWDINQINTDKPSCYTSASQMRDVYFDGPLSVNQFFIQSSYGHFKWTGDVMLCSLDYPSTERDGTEDCKNMARTLGYEPDNYQTLAFVSNGQGGAVSFGGIAKADQCELSWITHELGHQVGLQHATADWDNDGVRDGEYEDHADVMGWGYWTPNAPQRVKMGWLSSTVISANGTYVLTPVEASNGIRAYRFDSSSGDPYFFGYYQPIGFDAADVEPDGTAKPEGAIGSTSYSNGYTTGIDVYRLNLEGSNTRIIHQMTDGESYTILDTSVTIRQISHDSNGVIFAVTGIN